MLNAGLILSAWEAFDNELYALGGVISFVEFGFYAGNIYGARPPVPINSIVTAPTHSAKTSTGINRRPCPYPPFRPASPCVCVSIFSPMTASLQSFSIKLLRVSLLVAIFMVMAGIGTYVTLTLIIKTEDTVIVPDLVGKDVLVGLELLSDLGLNTRVKGIQYNDQVPQYHVMEQDPEPGSANQTGKGR